MLHCVSNVCKLAIFLRKLRFCFIHTKIRNSSLFANSCNRVTKSISKSSMISTCVLRTQMSFPTFSTNARSSKKFYKLLLLHFLKTSRNGRKLHCNFLPFLLVFRKSSNQSILTSFGGHIGRESKVCLLVFHQIEQLLCKRRCYLSSTFTVG